MMPSFKALAGCSAIVFVAAVGSYHSSSELQKRRLTLRGFFVLEDPKSIAKKQHEDSMDWKDFMALDNHEHVANLRILTMGSSRTYGATLKDRSTKSYPVLLSRNVTNLAIRATGPDYPSLCTYSMIGEDAKFDAIVLEFFLDADENLIRLVGRLRQRYPQATIVLLRISGPLQYIHLPTDSSEGIRYFLEQHKLFMRDPNFMTILKKETNSDDWQFEPLSHQIEMQQKAIHESGALLWELPRPDDPFEAFELYRHMYANDLVHFSEAGHEIIADGLRRMLASVRRNDGIGIWEHDFCLSWFESGTTTLESNEGVVMTEFDSKSHKWAMEMTSSDSWIIVQNPLGQAAQLFVRYMKTTPPPGLYPTTKVVTEGGTNEQVVLNPTGKNTNSRAHVNRIAKIGTIPPGEMKIYFTPIEKGKQYPFRVTGVAITPFDEEFVK